MAGIVSAAPVSLVEIKGQASKPAKSAQNEKGKDKTQKANEQRLGIRDPIISKKQASFQKGSGKTDGKLQLSKSTESLATTDPLKGAVLAEVLASDVSEMDTKFAVTAAAEHADSEKVESDCLERLPHGNSASESSPAREGTADVQGKDAALAAAADDIENCDISSWPDFSLDSFDGGEIDELDMSGSLILPELEEMSQKDQSQAEPEASADTRPSETSSKSVQQSEQYESSCKSGSKTSTGKKKAKVDWTPELHRRFVLAVEQLGVEKAIPSRILELMGVKCLTRHNIASHLQKYRSHRRHLAAREAEAANWHSRKPSDGMVWPGQPTATAAAAAPTSWAYPTTAPAPSGAQSNPPMIQPRPVVGVPPYQPYQMAQSHMPMAHHQPSMAPSPAPAMGMPMHVWGHPTVDHSRSHMWQQPQHQAAPSPYPPPAWFAPDGSVWHYAGVQAPSPAMDAWGHPTMMVSGTPCYPHQQAPALSYPVAQGVVCGAPVCGPAGMTHGAMPGMQSSIGVPAQGSVAMGATPAGVMPGTMATTGTVNGTVSGTMGGTMGGAVGGMAPVPVSEPADIADEAMPNPMFPLPDDITLDFAAITASLGEDLIEANDILDAAISEALTNPSTPMPLGLKPPSVDGVLEELNKQGITMPPATPEALDALPAAEVAAVASELEAILEP
ncbi:unnamed protein product [Closterium sp. Yama58-4]|nr:unnamed protein product [Closterium sp. Yama58-4]